MNFSALNATVINGLATSVVLAFASLLSAGSVAANVVATYAASVSANAGAVMEARATRYVAPVASADVSATVVSAADRTAFVSTRAEPYVEIAAFAVRTAFGASGFWTTASVAVDPYKTFVGQLATSTCNVVVTADATRVQIGGAQLNASALLAPFASYFTGYLFSDVQCSSTLLANANQENAASASFVAACGAAYVPTAYRFVSAEIASAVFAAAQGVVDRRVRVSVLGESSVTPLAYRATFAQLNVEPYVVVELYGSVIYKAQVHLDAFAVLSAVPDVTVRFAQATPVVACVATVNRLVVNPLADDPNGRVFYRTSNGFFDLWRVA